MRIAMAIDRLEGAVGVMKDKRSRSVELAGELRRHAGSIEGMGGSGDVARELQSAARILEEQADLIDRLWRDLARRIDIARTLMLTPATTPVGLVLGVAAAFRGLLAGLGRRPGVALRAPSPEEDSALLAYAEAFSEQAAERHWLKQVAPATKWRSVARRLVVLNGIVVAATEYRELSDRHDLSPAQRLLGTALKTSFVVGADQVGGVIGAGIGASACAAATVTAPAAPACAIVGRVVGGAIAGNAAGAAYERYIEEDWLLFIGEAERDAWGIVR